jgi:hypothetical protein
VTAAGGALAAAAATLLFPRPPAIETPPAPVLTATIAAALAPLLGGDGDVVVLGVGELHQTTSTQAISSSLGRFTREIWPLLASRASDLIVETWVTDGACGRAESGTVDQVGKTTERPAATESEIVTLLQRAKASGARPHVLKIDCADYRLLAGGGGRGRDEGALDFQRMLALIRRKLEGQVAGVLATRPAADAGKLVVVYGGALHNDLHPDPSLAPFSYGVATFRATLGRYRELDLYVPEYLERTPTMHKEPWFGAWRAAAQPGKLVTIRCSSASMILVFPAAHP